MPARKPAPRVEIEAHRDLRKEQLDELDAKDPDFVHSYQRHDVSDWDLKIRKQERVNGENGEPLSHVEDIVVRQPRDEFEARQKAEGDFSRRQVESIVDRRKSTVRRSPKEQHDADKE